MAQDSGLVCRDCLEWNTERPTLDSPRQSSNFSLLGCDWYFKLRKSYKSYDVVLCKINDKEPLSTGLNITVIAISKICYYCLHKSFTWSSSQTIAATFSFDDANKSLDYNVEYSQWTLLFVFQSKSPIKLQLHDSVTRDLSTQTDFYLPLKSTNESSVQTEEKLAACVPSDSATSLESLSLDFCKLLEQKSFPDVTLRCGDCTFPAHRSILTARSEVFAAMFRNKMVESETATVDITDMDSKVLHLLLKYVYSGKIPDFSEDNASSLYVTADKYSIHALKKECSSWMVGNLTQENCFSFLLLADTCSDNSLKDMVVNFIVGILELLDKDAWSKFNDEHPRLAYSVYHTHWKAILTKKTELQKE